MAPLGDIEQAIFCLDWESKGSGIFFYAVKIKIPSRGPKIFASGKNICGRFNAVDPLFTFSSTLCRLVKNKTIMIARNNVLSALGRLMSSLSQNTFTDAELRHIGQSLDALSEAPKSVSIDRSKLELVWLDSERYLGVNASGKLILLLNPSHAKKKDFLKTLLMQYGINKERIVVVISNEQNAENLLNSDRCRAVLYTRDSPKSLLSFLSPETSAQMQSTSSLHVKKAVVELAEKLK